eukprot:TRINITY_DN40941_c0_g1_i1.p1 TRINITY_DN40941_c0_g1~~TRINITY_DN40941_c0_g1_i1.p1  ORF type:complete len:486 (+),score=115.06 TRINITY_DN40941_c0_g1_i1:44-1459(+)
MATAGLVPAEKSFLKCAKKLRDILKLESQEFLAANQRAKVETKGETIEELCRWRSELPPNSDVATRNSDIIALLPAQTSFELYSNDAADGEPAAVADVAKLELCSARLGDELSPCPAERDASVADIGEGSVAASTAHCGASREAEPEAVREATPKGCFMASFDGVPVSTTMNCLGLLGMPLVGRYPYVDMWDIETKVAVRSGSAWMPRLQDRLPPPVQDALLAKGRLAEKFDFFFVAQDVSKINAGSSPSVFNVLHHAWAYPDLAPGRRCGYGDPWEVGVFSFKGSGVMPLAKADMAFQALSPAQIHIHPQRGGMCCSPNNGRLQVVGGAPACWFWSVAVLSPNDGSVPEFPRACVALHLMFLKPVSAAVNAALDCPTVLGMLGGLSHALGQCSAVAAALRAFGEPMEVPTPWPEAEARTETGPTPSTRPGPFSGRSGDVEGPEGGGRRGGRSGGGRGGRGEGRRGGRGSS